MFSELKSAARDAVLRRLVGPTVLTSREALLQVPGVQKSLQERADTTARGRDCEAIPKVAGAGTLKTIDGTTYQIMHNGTIVEAAGYSGDWTVSIIERLRGHHEPQEEKVFNRILERVSESGTMIELGASWAYYSIWFNKSVTDARNLCCEPDGPSLALGRRNAQANACVGMEFVRAAAGRDDGAIISFSPEGVEQEPESVTVRTVDSLVDERGIKQVDVLHMDIQGQELAALEGAARTIESGKVRFLFVSTHHYLISNDPLIHEKCRAKILEFGGHIITDCAIHEGLSGDGLLVASFDPRDSDLRVDVELSRMEDSLYRPYNQDVAILLQAYDSLSQRVSLSNDASPYWLRLLVSGRDLLWSLGRTAAGKMSAKRKS